MSEERSRRISPHPGRVLKRAREQMQAGPSSGSSASTTTTTTTSSSSSSSTSSSTSSAATPAAAGPSLILPGNALGYPSQQRQQHANQNRYSQSASPQTVIDLTDSPPPILDRYGRPGNIATRSNRAEVIDVDALPDSPPRPLPPRFGQPGWRGHQYDEEMAMLFARDATQNLLTGRNGVNFGSHRRISPPRPVEPSALYSQVGPDAPFQPRFYHQQDDPIMAHGGMAGQGPAGRSVMGGYNPMGSNYPTPRGVMEMLHSVRTTGPRVLDGIHFQQRNNIGIERHFQPPGQLDYSQRAAGIIREDLPIIEDVVRARNIDYKAPPLAREGYTRSPTENDILVCAECQTELGAEYLDETQEQVWASKCGHCYCGKCVLSFRIPPVTKNGRKGARPKQKLCVVCLKLNLAAKSNMFKIHL